jgi:hypothetical protein
LQHAGNFSAAAALADEARSMDLADRYLNSECVMQMLQADQVQLNWVPFLQFSLLSSPILRIDFLRGNY